MAPTIKTWILLTILSIIIKPEILIQAQQQVPCLFFYGDSQFDNGNNNVLNTTAKANYLPYGDIYPAGPTGRFSNGRNIPDFLAEFLGFAHPIPPFATAKDTNSVLTGLNYASGGAGLLDESGMHLGERMSLKRQVVNHQSTVGHIKRLHKNSGIHTTAEYLKKCLYVIGIGSNDYINNYVLPNSQSRQLTNPDKFAGILIKRLSEQLRKLYKAGARKVAVFGIGLIGCLPQEILLYPNNTSICVDFINGEIQFFNKRMKTLIDELNKDLVGAQFTFINVTNISLGDPSEIGITIANQPCCVVDKESGLCVPDQAPCNNVNQHLFWDNFHPTEMLNRGTASRAYTAAFPSDAYPVDIQHLAKQ